MKKIFLLFLLPAMIFLVACKDKEEAEPAAEETTASKLTVEPNFITCPDVGGDYTITVSSPNGAWTATPSDSWIRVNPSSGNQGTAEVRIKINTNKESVETQGKITFVSGEQKVEMPITRAAKAAPYLRVVSEKELNTPKEGGSYTVQVESNIKWSIASNTGWAKVNKGVSVNNDNITITVSAATMPEETTATITVKPYGEGYDAGEQTVVITRGSTDATSLTVDPTEVNAPENGGSFTVNVSSNAKWRVYKTWDMDWLTLNEPAEGNGSGSFGFSIEAATSMDAVSGILTIEEDRNDNYKPVVTQVAVSRAGKAAASLSVNPTKITSECTGGTFPVEIKSNYPWTASIVGAKYFSVSTTSGDGDATMIVTVKPTTDKEEGTGSITIRSTFGNEQAKINIRRLGYNLEMSVSVDDLNVPYGGLFQLVNVKHKYSYSVTSSDTTVVKVYEGYNSVTTEELIYLDVLPSLVRTTSTATVTFQSDFDRNISKTITVTRAALPDYILPGLFEVGLVARYFDYYTHDLVGKPKQVYFSKGNLQYQASTNTWRFAEHQYDIVGTIGKGEKYGETINYGNVKEGSEYCDNALISPTYSGWIDLFGWGTGDNPTKVSVNTSDYSTYHEWGDNAISNGGNKANQWRTLTEQEWFNLIHRERSIANPTILLLTTGYVNGLVNGRSNEGLFLYPDAYTGYINMSLSISQSDMVSLDNIGVVFLPSVFERVSNSKSCTFINTNSNGCYYWTASSKDSNYAYMLIQLDNPTLSHDSKYVGLAVRLVQDTYIE